MSKQPRRRPSRRTTDGQTSSGSEAPSTGPEFLIVGHIIRPHGVRGDLAMRVSTVYPERLNEVETLYVGDSQTPYTLTRARQHRQGMLVTFAEIKDRDQAEMLRGETVYVHLDDAVPLEDGEYYLYQIEGIQVITDEGVTLGHLTDYIETGANDVYIITTGDGSKVLIPAIPDVILSVDLDANVMTVKLLEGLLPE